MEKIIVFSIYAAWNIAVFALMGIDKFKAEKNMWRVKESTLLTAAFFMGAVGEIIGARVFHHKTQKTKFKIGLPVALLFNIAVAALVIYCFFR